MSIHVMQGERELVQDCRSLARFALRGIPALPAGGAHIRVTFQVDADGLLSVTAMEKSTGVEASIQVKPSYGLTDGEIASMIKDSMSYAEQDIQARMLAEQKVEAARVLESLTRRAGCRCRAVKRRGASGHRCRCGAGTRRSGRRRR